MKARFINMCLLICNILFIPLLIGFMFYSPDFLNTCQDFTINDEINILKSRKVFPGDRFAFEKSSKDYFEKNLSYNGFQYEKALSVMTYSKDSGKSIYEECMKNKENLIFDSSIEKYCSKKNESEQYLRLVNLKQNYTHANDLSSEDIKEFFNDDYFNAYDLELIFLKRHNLKLDRKIEELKSALRNKESFFGQIKGANKKVIYIKN